MQLVDRKSLLKCRPTQWNPILVKAKIMTRFDGKLSLAASKSQASEEKKQLRLHRIALLGTSRRCPAELSGAERIKPFPVGDQFADVVPTLENSKNSAGDQNSLLAKSKQRYSQASQSSSVRERASVSVHPATRTPSRKHPPHFLMYHEPLIFCLSVSRKASSYISSLLLTKCALSCAKT